MTNTTINHKDTRRSQHINTRHHIKHPIPYDMEVVPVGRTLTQMEWNKFCERNLNSKSLLHCVRTHDGTLLFLGEGGLNALIIFQEKYKDRFHLRMICANKTFADQGLKLASEKGVVIEELHYKNGHGMTKTQIMH